MREAGAVQEIQARRGQERREGEREVPEWRGARGGSSKEDKKNHRPKKAHRAEIVGL